MNAIVLILFKLTLWEVIADVPHDGPALVVYAMLGLFVAGIWYGSRNKSAAAGRAAAGSGDHN
jgi:hypothetical protein